MSENEPIDDLPLPGEEPAKGTVPVGEEYLADSDQFPEGLPAVPAAPEVPGPLDERTREKEASAARERDLIRREKEALRAEQTRRAAEKSGAQKQRLGGHTAKVQRAKQERARREEVKQTAALGEEMFAEEQRKSSPEAMALPKITAPLPAWTDEDDRATDAPRQPRKLFEGQLPGYATQAEQPPGVGEMPTAGPQEGPATGGERTTEILALLTELVRAGEEAHTVLDGLAKAVEDVKTAVDGLKDEATARYG